MDSRVVRRSHPTVAEIAFGLPPSVVDANGRDMAGAIAEFLSQRISRRVVLFQALSYDDLSCQFTCGELDAAWFPSALFVELDRSVGLRAVASAERCEGIGYYAAFFFLRGRAVTSFDALRGRSVGWVDPNSASGYVFPRLQLAAMGIDPTDFFQEEVFFRSHEAVVRAVLGSAVDVGATFVHTDPCNPKKIVRAGWDACHGEFDASQIATLDPFGPVPADVIATAKSIPKDIADDLGRAFLEIHTVREIARVAAQQFGTGRFAPFNPGAYGGLHSAMDMVEGSGLEVASSLRPSGLS